MRFYKLFSFAAVILCSTMGLAYAETPASSEAHGEGHMHMMQADTNHDGKVSYEEYRAASEKRDQKHFKRMDTNGDGFIDESEKKAAYDKMKAFREQHKAAHPEPSKPITP